MRGSSKNIYGGACIMKADSVKARLKNFAIRSGCTFQKALTCYGLERTIYRISGQNYDRL